MRRGVYMSSKLLVVIATGNKEKAFEHPINEGEGRLKEKVKINLS